MAEMKPVSKKKRKRIMLEILAAGFLVGRDIPDKDETVLILADFAELAINAEKAGI